MTPAATRSRDQRRAALMRSPRLRGLDHAEVTGPPRPAGDGEELWEVELHFVAASPEVDKEALPAELRPGQVRFLLDGVPDPRLRVEAVRRRGEEGFFSVTLRTLEPVEPDPHQAPVYRIDLVGVPEMDPLFSAVTVRLAPGDDAVLPRPRSGGAPRPNRAEPTDYLAKDYDSFRRLLLERMAAHVPSWEERNPSDLGVTLVEVLAYAGDYLSYYQDAVAGEAYLDSARRRISVRRHARLLDFRLEEGTVARAWVQIQVSPEGERLHGEPGPEAGPTVRVDAGTRLLTSSARLPGVVAAGSREHLRALEEGALVFRTLHDAVLRPHGQTYELHTWGAEDWTLDAGSTSATLVGHHPHLRAGEVLVFEKYVGVSHAGDMVADPRERQAVRLSRPPELRRDPLPDGGVDVTEIHWFDVDAPAVDLPVSRAEGAVLHRNLTVVHGNVVLVDHGERLEELLEPVPAEGRWNPRLSRTGLANRVPFDPRAALRQPASWALRPSQSQTLPEVELIEFPSHAAPATVEEARAMLGPWQPRWRPCFDLLGSDRFARELVVETDDSGIHHLRFGDGVHGRRPAPGSRMLARYSLGGGPRGNVGSHAIRHVVVGERLQRRLDDAGLVLEGADNHLPAAGGRLAIPAEQARVYAPERIHAEEFQRRCVTEEDSRRIAEAHPEVLRAVARHRWLGSTPAVFLYVQRHQGLPVDADLEERLREVVEPCLLVGWELALRNPRYVPVDVEVTVWLEPGVPKERLQRQLTEMRLTGRNLFDPDGFGFGQPVYLSQLTSRIVEAPGVADLRVDAFHRWGRPPAGELEAGVIPIGPLEIARLDNDPEAPQRGTLEIHLREAGE